MADLKSSWRRQVEGGGGGASTAPESGPESAGRQPAGGEPAPQPQQRTQEPAGQTMEETRETIKRLLAVADANVRKELDLPEREGVDVPTSDAGSLDMAADLITPWAHQNQGAVTPGVQAGVGLAVIVGELIKDGALDGLRGAAPEEEIQVPEHVDPDDWED